MSNIKRNLPGGGVYEKTVLADGIRIVTERNPSARSVSIGVWVDVGSRNEIDQESGLSHFIEHMVFKGTPRRSARQIADSLESLGGSLNAFTSREHTCFTARVLDEYTEDALDVLADITCNARMTRANMTREGLVICEEIKESLDSPGDHVHDLFAETYWGQHPLGQPIMGTADHITGMTRARMIAFMKRHYRAESVVIAASGSISHRKLVRFVRDNFSFESGASEVPLRAKRTRESHITIARTKGNQVHLCLGFPAFSYLDRKRMAAMVLNTYLGGGMSSLLFQKVREEKGMAYSIYSYLDFYRDAGLLGCYLSTDSTRLEQAYSIMLAQCKQLKRNRITPNMLTKVKAQIKGNLTLSLESTGSKMHRIGRMELVMGRYQPLRTTLKEIDKVTAGDVLSVANQIFDESRIALTALGPVKSGFGSTS